MESKKECRLASYTATGKGLRKDQPKCFETCPNFREEVCHRLARPPFVCNGCAKEHNFYCSSQEPHIERFHNDLRRILQKGRNLPTLAEDEIASFRQLIDLRHP